LDIPRKDLVRKRRIRRIVYSVAAAAAIGVITFGLGTDPIVQSLEVRWTSGVVDRFDDLAPNSEIVLEEGQSLL